MKKGEKQDGSFVKQVSIADEKRQLRFCIPQFLVEIFDIDCKEDKINWYVKKVGNRVKLFALLSKKGQSTNVFIKKSGEEFFKEEKSNTRSKNG